MLHTQTYSVCDHVDKTHTRPNQPESQNEFGRVRDVPLLVEELLAMDVRGGKPHKLEKFRMREEVRKAR